MTKLTRAVIPAAGYGTRMLPISSVVSKEMLPLVDKPILQYVIEELVDAGVTEIIIVTNGLKADMVQYFSRPEPSLIAYLELVGGDKAALADSVRRACELARITFVQQRPTPYGTGTPVLDAAPYLHDEPFIYTFGDDFFAGERNSYQQLLEVYEQYRRPVMACLRRDNLEDYQRYGYAGGTDMGNGVVGVEGIVERPGSAEASPGKLASVGGFVVTPDVYGYLNAELTALQPGKEFQFNAAFKRMLSDGKQVLAKEIEGCQYFDTGNKLEYMKAAVAMAAQHSEIGPDFRQFLKDFTHKETSS